MNSEGHLKKAQEIYDDIMILKEHDGDAHVSSIVELAYGCAFHYLAYGCDRRAGTHVDIHAGLPRLLSSTGDDAIADLFRELDVIRHGRGRRKGQWSDHCPGSGDSGYDHTVEPTTMSATTTAMNVVPAAVELAQSLKGIPTLEAVILFGSAATGRDAQEERHRPSLVIQCRP